MQNVSQEEAFLKGLRRLNDAECPWEKLAHAWRSCELLCDDFLRHESRCRLAVAIFLFGLARVGARRGAMMQEMRAPSRYKQGLKV